MTIQDPDRAGPASTTRDDGPTLIPAPAGRGGAGTVREGLPNGTGAPTTREAPAGGGAPTTREGFGGNGARTTREAGGPGGSAGQPPDSEELPSYRRYNLPPPLQHEYRVIRELSTSGAEADLLLCAPVAGGTPVVVKLYRGRRDGLDEAMLRVVQSVDPDHVVQVIDWNSFAGHWWEIQEYVEYGSLDDLIIREGPSLPLPLLDQILRELTPALAALHQHGLVHRDIKPSNILVRSRDPLDLVVSDFGLVIAIQLEREMRSASRTPAYAAPESAFGATSAGRDWWSLGMTLLELALGEHPFRPGGRWLQDGEIGALLATTPMDVSEVPDRRWRNLLRGLLTANPEDRWGLAQVDAWLDGADPAVAEAAPISEPRPAVRPLVFMGVGHTEPETLAEHMAREWGAAAELIVGRGLTDLEQWIGQFDPGPAVTGALVSARSRATNVDRLVARLLLALAPDQPPVFQGFGVGPGDVSRLARVAAAAPGRERRAIAALRASSGLLEYTRVPGCETYDQLNQAWNDEVGDVVMQLSGSGLPAAIRALPGDEAAAALLSAMLDVEARRGLAKSAQTAARRGGSSVTWYRDLTGMGAAAARPSRQWLMVAASPIAREEEELARRHDRATQEADQRAASASRLARELPALHARDRRLRRLLILLCITGVGPYYIGMWVWERYLADPIPARRSMAALWAGAAYAPQITFGALALCGVAGLLMLLLPPWRTGGGRRLAGIAVLVALGVASPYAAGQAQQTLVGQADERYRVQAVPIDRIGPVCGTYWTSAPPAGAPVQRFALVARRSVNGGVYCTALVAYTGWTRNFIKRTPKNAWFASLGSYQNLLVIRESILNAPNRLLAYDENSGKAKWQWTCPKPDNRYPGDEVYHGVGSAPGSDYITVTCSSGQYRIDLKGHDRRVGS